MSRVSELKKSRKRRTTIDAMSDMRSRTYIAQDFADDEAAETAVLAYAPATVNDYPIVETNVAEVMAGQVYLVDIVYARLAFDPEYQFDISGEQVNRTVPILVRSSLPATFPTPKLIHDRGDGTADGVPVEVTRFAFNEVYYFPKESVNDAYKATLYALANKMNDRAWRIFQQGEVLFKGVTGTQRGNLPWRLDFRFVANPNAVDQVWTLEGGDVTVPLKYGHDYQWFSTIPKAPSVGTDEPALSLQTSPLATHVAQVVEWMNPLLIGIGS